MQITKTFYPKNRDAWRAWLEKNCSKETEVWLVFYKQDPSHPGVPYDAAVEEALCFGWIDSVIQKIDEEKYVRKFSPRKPESRWSASNKARVAKLIEQGKMTEAGRKTLNYTGTHDDYGRTPEQRKQDLTVPPYFKQALVKNGNAWENFCALAPSYRRIYLLRVKDAKTQATRDKRVADAVARLERNEKPGIK